MCMIIQVTLELSSALELDSMLLATQISSSVELPAAQQLADDMMVRLDEFEAYCQSLIKQRKVSLTCWSKPWAYPYTSSQYSFAL